MAFDFSKLNFFSKLDARARVFVLFGGLVGVGFAIYLTVVLLSSGSTTVGPSKVASAPRGLQSVPGGQLTPEYYRALQQANQQAAQQAQISGGSAVPTLINTGQQVSSGGGGDCTVLCGDDAVDVGDTMETWVRQGKLSPDTAKQLDELAKKNVSVAEYAAELDRLVREGKLTPEQARKLLEQYKKQHTSQSMKESAKTMDALIKAGKLSIEDANALLEAQKRKVSPEEYEAMLQRMVREGKIDAQTAQRLLNEYLKQRAKDVIAGSITSLKKMAEQGQITSDVLNELIPLEEQMVPVGRYQRKLNEFVEAGKITPVVAGKILDEFKAQKKAIGARGSSADKYAEAAKEASYKTLSDLVASGRIDKNTAAKLAKMIESDMPCDQYEAEVKKLVQAGKVQAQDAERLLSDCSKREGLKGLAGKLQELQDNNASAQDYEAALRDAVAKGLISPEEAAQLLAEYKNNQERLAAASAASPRQAGGTGEFAKLQERLLASEGQQQPVDTGVSEQAAEDFSAAQLASQQEMMAAQQERISAMANAMTAQAQQLVASWQPPKMAHTEGSPPEDKDAAQASDGAAGGAAANGATGDDATAASNQPVLVKAGDILFAVLDTAVNSDYPDSPVMATIVAGKYKGAKMLGKLVTTKGVSGQLDRVTLNFTIMNTDDWPKSKSVTAYAIDPDTARTVLASSVDYHYMLRFGAIMATSFVEGYANAISSSSATTTTGIFGTSTTNPELSPAQKLATAIGQIGTALGEVTKKYTERPPTVRVNAGVGLGILFMTDVS